MKGQKPPAPIRGAKPSDNAEEEDEADGEGEDGEPEVADLVPRIDVG